MANLLRLAPARRMTVAVRLAEVVEPLGDLAVLTPEPLSDLAERIRGGRRAEDEEPDGPAFFAHEARRAL